MFKPQKPIDYERPSPQDWLPASAIKWDRSKGRLTVDLPKNGEIWITDVQDTNSMDGFFDIGHSVVLWNGFKSDRLAIGDIAVYYNSQYPMGCIHQIIDIKTVDYGLEFTFQGMNPLITIPDPVPVRVGEIRWVMLGVIY